ncbi:acidic mammalian chitinase-like isoform X1 [Culex pipiens pallens]|uniref:acidic mammalian chitinase-like isoform X1 n=1 Tax=Culex pipiens pallens TaxID=42434 RepID=UPI0019544A12|nr:acidic mammalian chitinase-like isoform X1 [Culex pipiens pallens]
MPRRGTSALWLIGAVLLGLVWRVAGEKNTLCYYGSWATYRPARGRFEVENINPHLCTHLVYTFFGLHANGTIHVLDPWLDLEDNWGRGNIRRFNELKNINPRLKTLAAIGGYNEGSEDFSKVADSADLRHVFAEDCRDFCLRHGFDGVDIDWEYPSTADRTNFVLLLADLRQVLSEAGLMLTAAVAAHVDQAAISYDIPSISVLLDHINLMAYDFNGAWNSVTGHNAPLFAGPADVTDFQRTLNVDYSVRYWLGQGAPAFKMNVGVAFYGRTFTLANTALSGLQAPAIGPGLAGPYSRQEGWLAYFEICTNFPINDWIRHWDNDQRIPFGVMGDQWIGYDDVESVQQKCDYIYQHNLGGAMVWSIDQDDFHGYCGVQYPLLWTLERCFN